MEGNNLFPPQNSEMDKYKKGNYTTNMVHKHNRKLLVYSLLMMMLSKFSNIHFCQMQFLLTRSIPKILSEGVWYF